MTRPADDPIELNLKMEDYDVPCILQMFQPQCQQRAVVLTYFKHQAEGTPACFPPMPLCTGHAMLFRPNNFWARWFGHGQAEGGTGPCECGVEVEYDREEPIRE